MHPYFHLFGLTVPAYGLCMMLAVFLCCTLSILQAKKRGICVEDMLILSAAAVGCAILGAGGLYLAVTYTPQQLADFLRRGDFSFLQNAGLVFYGGLIGGAVGGLLTARKLKLNLQTLLPCVVPYLPMAHALGRIGCLLAGCCHGMAYTGPLAVKNLALSPHATFFPIQGAEAVCNLLISGLLLLLRKKPQLHHRLLSLYFLLYAPVRFAAEFFRADALRGSLWHLSTSQWISLGLLIFSVITLCRKAPQKKETA